MASAVNEQNNRLWQRLESHVQNQLTNIRSTLPTISVTCPQRQNSVWFLGCSFSSSSFVSPPDFLRFWCCIERTINCSLIHSLSKWHGCITFSFLRCLCCLVLPLLLMLFYFCIIITNMYEYQFRKKPSDSVLCAPVHWPKRSMASPNWKIADSFMFGRFFFHLSKIKSTQCK